MIVVGGTEVQRRGPLSVVVDGAVLVDVHTDYPAGGPWPEHWALEDGTDDPGAFTVLHDSPAGFMRREAAAGPAGDYGGEKHNSAAGHLIDVGADGVVISAIVGEQNNSRYAGIGFGSTGAGWYGAAFHPDWTAGAELRTPAGAVYVAAPKDLGYWPAKVFVQGTQMRTWFRGALIDDRVVAAMGATAYGRLHHHVAAGEVGRIGYRDIVVCRGNVVRIQDAQGEGIELHHPDGEILSAELVDGAASIDCEDLVFPFARLDVLGAGGTVVDSIEQRIVGGTTFGYPTVAAPGGIVRTFRRF